MIVTRATRQGGVGFIFPVRRPFYRVPFDEGKFRNLPAEVMLHVSLSRGA